MSLAIRLGKREKADIFVIKMAVLLHDIGRKKENKTMECHAEMSARLAKNILARHRLSREVAGNVVHCI